MLLKLALLMAVLGTAMETQTAFPSTSGSRVSTTARERAWERVAARAAAAEAAAAARAEGAPPLALVAPPDDAAKQELSSLPLSIGIRTLDGLCERLLVRGSALPTRAERIFTTTDDNQPTAQIMLFMGERPLCDGNRLLGNITLVGLPEASYRSFVQLEVVLEVGIDGVLDCRVAEMEGRALGEDFAQAWWRGSVLGINLAELDVRDNAATYSHAKRGKNEIAVFSHALAKHLPVLLATRVVKLPSGRNVVIRQHQRREEERVGTGGVLWEAAIVLADYVGRRRDYFSWPGQRVLELGAGTGLVAIALAAEGAHVWATDGNPKVVQCAGKNVQDARDLPGRINLEVFDWNSVDDLRRIQAAGPWDVILGSDLVYPGNAGRRCVASNDDKPPADVTLLSLLGSLASYETKVVLALKDRTGEVERFIDLVANMHEAWSLTLAPRETIMPEFRALPALAMLHLQRLPSGAQGLQEMRQ